MELPHRGDAIQLVAKPFPHTADIGQLGAFVLKRSLNTSFLPAQSDSTVLSVVKSDACATVGPRGNLKEYMEALPCILTVFCVAFSIGKNLEEVLTTGQAVAPRRARARAALRYH